MTAILFGLSHSKLFNFSECDDSFRVAKIALKQTYSVFSFEILQISDYAGRNHISSITFFKLSQISFLVYVSFSSTRL